MGQAYTFPPSRMIRMILLKNHFLKDGMKAHCTIMSCLQSKEEMITEAYEKVAVVAALNSSCSYP
jgi:hypothetical protein